MGKRAVQTLEVKDCALPAPPGIKGRAAQRGGAEAGGSVAASRCSPGRMRLAVRTLLACAVLGECGRGEGPQRRRPRRPLQPGPHHTCRWAPRWGWKHRSPSLALPHCTPAPALALPQGPADPAFASADPSCSSCFLLPSLEVEYNKLEHFRHGLANPFARAFLVKTKLFSVAFKVSSHLISPWQSDVSREFLALLR